MHALARLCIKRPVFATMLIMAFVVSGVFTYFSLGLDLMPKIDFPFVVVMTANPGASPEEVETEISKKIEDAVNSISGLDELQSRSYEGLSLVIAVFDLSKDGNVAAQEVQNNVNQIVNNLPASADVPVVIKIDPDAQAVMQIAVSAPRSTRDVTLIADKLIKQNLENISGVGQVQINGGVNREIHVIVDPDRLRAYNLTVTDIFFALQSQNMEMPGGSVKAGEKDYTIRTSGKLRNVADFNDIAITQRGDYVVKLSDVARAVDANEEPSSAVRLDGEPAVQIAVSKQSGANTVAVVDAVIKRLAEIKEIIPKDVHIEVIDDQSVFIRASINSIRNHLFEGSLLACVVIFIFLANWRTTLIAAIAIPTSLISAFSIMAMFGYTMNMITMLALTLMIGVVIDDAIIVLENIYRYMEEKKVSAFEAAVHGTKEIGLAVLAATISLLAVFIPVGFMGGIAGRFMSAFGFVCAGAVAISMLVSFTLTPMLCSRFIRTPAHDGSEKKSKDSKFFRIIDATYTKSLVWSMAHRKVVVLACVLAVASIVPLFKMSGVNMMAKDDRSQLRVSIRLPEGSSLAETTRYSEIVARRLREIPEVIHTFNTVGGGSFGIGAMNESTTLVTLSDIKDRSRSSEEIASYMRDMFKDHDPDIFIAVTTPAMMGGGGQADVEYYLQGPELEKLEEYSGKLLEQARLIPGLGDIDTSYRTGKPEVRLDIDRDKAADLGVSVMAVAQTLYALVAGQTAGTFFAGSDQYDVVVKAESRFRNSAEGLEKLTVASTKTGSVGLNEVVVQKESSGPSSIRRLNRQRIVTISGNLMPGGDTDSAKKAMEAAAAELNMDTGYSGGSTGIAREMDRTARYFLVAFALAFIFMYITLAAQFESFIHPVTILLAMPLAVPFGLLSMLLARQDISIMSGLGLLLLFGIVEKNAILQIDRINGLRAEGMPLYEAVIQANRDRLRPILMTTMALVCGMIPLMLSSGAGASTNHAVGFLVAGGQTLCLFLTLLAVPVFYSIWEDLGTFFSSRKQKLKEERVNGKTIAVTTILALLLLLPASSLLNAQDLGDNMTAALLKQIEAVQVPPRVGITGERRLTLEQVIEQVLANDPALEISHITLNSAEYGITAAKGHYDPVLSLDMSALKAATPVVSAVSWGATSGSLESKEFSLKPRVSGNTPWIGSSYSLEFSNAKQDTDMLLSTLNPQYLSSITFNYMQPLWRGLRIDSGRRTLALSRKNRDLSLEQTRLDTIERVTQAVMCYWELVWAWQNLEVQNEAVRLALEQFFSNLRMSEQGIIAQIDVVAAVAQLANYQQAPASAQQQLVSAENNLKQMIARDRNDPLWQLALIPETSPEAVLANAKAPLFEDALRRALASRPELAASDISMEINRINQNYYNNLTKPKVDAVATIALSGLAGTTTAAGSSSISDLPGGEFPEHLLGGNADSLSNILNGRYSTFRVGVSISLPLRNREALSNAAIAQSDAKRLEARKKQLEMYIEADVRNALERWNSARVRYEAAVIARGAAEEQYASEQRQFQAGVSTMFMVFERQTRFIAARSGEVRAKADLAEAIADMDRAVARTLETYNIRLAD